MSIACALAEAHHFSGTKPSTWDTRVVEGATNDASRDQKRVTRAREAVGTEFFTFHDEEPAARSGQVQLRTLGAGAAAHRRADHRDLCPRANSRCSRAAGGRPATPTSREGEEGEGNTCPTSCGPLFLLVGGAAFPPPSLWCSFLPSLCGRWWCSLFPFGWCFFFQSFFWVALRCPLTLHSSSLSLLLSSPPSPPNILRVVLAPPLLRWGGGASPPPSYMYNAHPSTMSIYDGRKQKEEERKCDWVSDSSSSSLLFLCTHRNGINQTNDSTNEERSCVSNMICDMRSWMALGLRLAFVSKTGCSSGATLSSLQNV